MPDDIALPKSWENLGIRPGFLEVVGQRAYSRKSREGLGSLFHELDLLDKPDTSDSLALFARGRPEHAGQPQDIKRPPRSQGPRWELAEAGREMPSSAQGPGSRGCRSQWDYTVGARGFDCGCEWGFDIVGVLQPQHNSSIQSLGSAPKILAWRASTTTVRPLYGLIVSPRITASTRAYATKKPRCGLETSSGRSTQMSVWKLVVARFHKTWLCTEDHEDLPSIISPPSHKLRNQNSIGRGNL